MQTLHFSIVINAPKEKVWSTMLDESTYKEWTRVFSPGSAESQFIGDWNEGSKILFVAPNEKGELEGMVSRIKENRPYEFLSIEHVGYMLNGKEDTTSDEVKQWAPAYENYTFVEKDGATEVLIDMDAEDRFADMFKDLWPKALLKLKEITEK